MKPKTAKELVAFRIDRGMRKRVLKAARKSSVTVGHVIRDCLSTGIGRWEISNGPVKPLDQGRDA